MSIEKINDENLEQIVGGFFAFDYNNKTITYTHDDGSVTIHNILDYDNAWKMSNNLHGLNYREDDILAKMIKEGYVAG